MEEVQPRVWTFQLVGGDPFGMGVPNNPQIKHDGGITLYHLVGSETLANQVGNLIESFGCRVTRTGELETPEQSSYHQQYIESQASLFPCMECVGCFWLDLHTEGYCGLESWGSVAREQSLKWYSKATSDAGSCPLGRGSQETG